MKEVKLKIPNNKFAFFMELVKELGFEIDDIMEISDEHKTIVRERIKTAKPEEMVPWEEARKQFNL